MTITYIYANIQTMIKTDDDKNDFFLIGSGNWQKIVNADSKQSAVKQAFEEITKDPEKYKLSKIIIIMNVEQTIKELSLENSLKFTSVVDVADYIGDKKLGQAIKTLFKDV